MIMWINRISINRNVEFVGMENLTVVYSYAIAPTSQKIFYIHVLYLLSNFFPFLACYIVDYFGPDETDLVKPSIDHTQSNYVSPSPTSKRFSKF